MPTKTLKFKRIRFSRPYERIKTRFARDAANLVKWEAAFTVRRAKTSMKKAPKKPKSRFGNLQAYSKRSNKYGKHFWRKGAHSRPGHPPFHHGGHFNLRKMEMIHTSKGVRRYGGIYSAYLVGPVQRRGRQRGQPVPGLMEYGGKVKITKKKKSFTSSGLKFMRMAGRRPSHRQGGTPIPAGSGMLTYAPRPYMRPAGKEARKSARAKKGGSLKFLVNLGGLKGRRTF